MIRPFTHAWTMHTRSLHLDYGCQQLDVSDADSLPISLYSGDSRSRFICATASSVVVVVLVAPSIFSEEQAEIDRISNFYLLLSALLDTNLNLHGLPTNSLLSFVNVRVSSAHKSILEAINGDFFNGQRHLRFDRQQTTSGRRIALFIQRTILSARQQDASTGNEARFII